MLRTRLQKSYIKRTIRPLYGWTQATPTLGFLDPNWDRSIAIWPGMCFARISGEEVGLIGAGQVPYGLVANYIGGDGIDELLDQGINATSVWVLSRDAQFEILAPAFDDGATWTDPGDGTEVLVYAYVDGVRRGKLTPAGTSGRGTLSNDPVARLLKVNSANKITVGGLR